MNNSIPRFAFTVAVCAAVLNAFASERAEIPLAGDGWRLWLDRDATWKDDVLHINPVDAAKIREGRGDWLEPVAVEGLQVAAPTCGWNALFSRSVPWTEAERAWKDKSLSVDVSVPGTVEGYFFDAISGDKKGDGTSGDYRGVSWWGRGFSVPASMKGRRVVLAFREGVRHRAEVFVNRRLAAYELVLQSPFEVDVTDFVRYGGENELAVRITDPNGEFSWGDYTFTRWGKYLFPLSHGFGGILGAVDLVATDPVRVEDIFVKTKADPRDIDVSVELRSSLKAGRTVDVFAEVVENWMGGKPAANPKTVYEKSLGKVEVPAGGSVMVNFSAKPDGVRLWDIRDANLYDMRITLRGDGGKVVDRAKARFGFRSAEWRGVGEDAQFFLNGRRVFLLSAISWGYWPGNGMIPTPELARKHVTAAIGIGMNMINFHRHRGNDLVLNAADELGVLYYEEPGSHSSYRHKRDADMTGIDQSVAHEICRQKLLRMVKNHRNHASLLMNNMVNEPGWDPDDLTKEDMALAHLLDPTRLISYGSGNSDPRKDQPQKLHMRPWDQRQYTFGFCDVHNAGNSPGVYVDANYSSPRGFLRSERDEKEIFIWGEEGALAAQPQLELIQQQKKGRPNGWDGQRYDQWYEGCRRYLDEKGLRGNFPSLTALLTSLGDIMYYEHGRLVENARIADGCEAYILNGYECMKLDNFSGAVDCYRNHKGDPSLISRYMKPLYVSVKAREKLGATGDVNVFDLFVINEHAIKGGEYTVAARVKTPGGKVRTLHKGSAKVSGGSKFSDLAAEGIEVPLDDGPGHYRIEAELLDASGKVIATGDDEMFAVDVRGKPIATKGAIIGGGMEYIRFAKDALGADLAAYDKSMGRLDYIILAPTDLGQTFRTVSSFNCRALDGESLGFTLSHFRGKKLENKIGTRISAAPIDFGVHSKPIPGYDLIGTTDFSVRWEGFVHSDYTGDVEFAYTFDDGARIWFDGELVLDKWTNGPKDTRKFMRHMKAGERHAIKIEAYQDGGDWRASLQWKLPVPECTVDFGDILRRVREDGTKLLLLEDAEQRVAELRKCGAFPEFKVFHPNKTWVGYNMFVKKHPIFDGLPVDCGFNWEYQCFEIYDGPKHFGLTMEGEEPVVGLLGIPLKGIATSLGIVPCGKGKIVFSSLDIAPHLTSDMKPSAVPKKVFANILRWASAD